MQRIPIVHRITQDIDRITQDNIARTLIQREHTAPAARVERATDGVVVLTA